MHTLETLFDSVQQERLLSAIPRRCACRAFSGAPDTVQWAKLTYLATRYALPGARVRILRCSEEVFTGTLFNMGRVTGCTTLAAVCATGGESIVWAGAAGEALVLDAQAMGLGSCWITGTYRKSMVHADLREGETLLGIIALGVPEKSANSEVTRRRKPMEKLCKGDPTLWAAEVRQAAELVRQAPSGLNGQPWRMTLTAEGFEVSAPVRNALDLGIGLCHAELGLTSAHTWRMVREGHSWTACAHV